MSLLEELKNEIQKLPVTAPIFNIRKGSGGWQGTCLLLEPSNKVNHHDVASDEMYKTDTMKALAMNCSRESIDTNAKAYKISVEGAVSNVYTELRRYMIHFLGMSLGRDSDVYKWYDIYALQERNLTKGYIEPMLGLYKYLCVNFNDPTMNGSDEKHKQNAIGILEFIYQRDFKEEHVPQPRKRRRRRK